MADELTKLKADFPRSAYATKWIRPMLAEYLEVIDRTWALQREPEKMIELAVEKQVVEKIMDNLNLTVNPTAPQDSEGFPE